MKPSSVLIIGSGPIVIGQGCEFDYSGVQALKALRAMGVRTILVNSNPATIMTDPEFADKTYIIPLVPEAVEDVIKRERPEALLPTLGGQTALNLAMALAESGVLETYKVRLIGARIEAIRTAESREMFREAMRSIGLEVPKSFVVKNMDEARRAIEELGFPVCLRPSFTLGGSGGEMAFSADEFDDLIARALFESPVHEVLVEQSLLNYKEFELEVVRDRKDNCVIVCSIENVDPMGVHTGDSITVAPQQTLTDKEYQKMRDSAIAVMRAIGVDTGGANIQFAVDPKTGKQFVIEMNPRVSRSSALASKATGYPIAKVATLLALGHTLDEIKNDITKVTTAAFEPALDYVAVKVPYFAFERFQGARQVLSTQMRSVGEAMALGRCFGSALEKALRSLEADEAGLGSLFFERILPTAQTGVEREETITKVFGLLSTPNPKRIFAVADALRLGVREEEVARLSGYDPFFVREIAGQVEIEREIFLRGLGGLTRECVHRAKRAGFSDKKIALLLGVREEEVRDIRARFGIYPVYNSVDTCAGEFEALTPYFYSTYEGESESRVAQTKKVVIIGSGPNRIGQGIEFDYCCVHGVMQAKEMGCEVVMINCNPETVSTDYDMVSKLYFEPLTWEDCSEVLRVERPLGVVVQFGGQTPLKIASKIEGAGYDVLGTDCNAIDVAEDRQRFSALAMELGLRMPQFAVAKTHEEALLSASIIGYPVLVRPSYVLGGLAMEIAHNEEELGKFLERAFEASGEHPVLIDRFLEGAVEIDVDAISDGEDVYVAAVMEHVEEAGIHSGDSACSIPPYTLKPHVVREVIKGVVKIAKALGVKGLLNCQFAIKDDTVYVLEANPRASRTVPFASKATSVPLAKIATMVMLGQKLKDIPLRRKGTGDFYAVKMPVFPFNKFQDIDPVLGPKMRSTGEVMGFGRSFGEAYLASAIGAGLRVKRSGFVFLSLKDSDKQSAVPIAKEFKELGFRLAATKGTAMVLREAGLGCEVVKKVSEGSPNAIDLLKEEALSLVINTPRGSGPRRDSAIIRRLAWIYGVPLITNVRQAFAMALALRSGRYAVVSLQELS